MDNNSSTNRITPKVTPVTPKVTPVVPKVASVTPKVALVTPKVAPVTPKVAPVTPKVSIFPKIKKFLLWGGIIVASLVLIVSGIIFLEWYNTTYIPEEETKKLEEVISQLRSLPSHEEKLARLSSAIAQYPKAQNINAHSLIRDLKDKINQEAAERELKQRQEAEKRKRELIRRQIAEREERLRQERESREQAILEHYRHSLNNNRSENIFILRENPALPEYQFILFQYNEELITKLQQLQKLKEQKHAFDNAMASLVKQYNSNNRNFSNAQKFIQMKNASANADQLLPALAAEIAASAKTLTVDANEGTHMVNCAFSDIPDGKWLIAGFSADGGMILQTITKNAGFPLFLNLQSDGFRDVSVKHYNQSEQEKLKRAIAAAALREKSKRAPATPNQEQNIRGLIFFAKLRDNLNATGGIPVRNKKKSVDFATINDIRTIKFSGTLAQGIRYRWKAITGDAPRTVSLWFCCTGYNKHDGGNAIFSYGIKDFGKYFDIETNSSQNLSCAWGEPSGLLVPKIENNRWNHLVITYDGTTRICYLNGKVASSIRTKLQTANSYLKIGTRLDDIAHCFVGGIRNVAVYNRALNKDEVIFLNNGGID